MNTRRLTTEDLAALTRTETEILSLPSTESHTTFEPLEQSPEYRAIPVVEAEDEHHEMVVVVTSCKGRGGFCDHHADAMLGHYFGDRALRREGKEDDVDFCPYGCGKKAIDCWSIDAIKPGFILTGLED